MKLYNPWTLAKDSPTPILAMSLVLTMAAFAIVAMHYFPVLFIGGLFTAVIGRVLYAILKGK